MKALKKAAIVLSVLVFPGLVQAQSTKATYQGGSILDRTTFSPSVGVIFTDVEFSNDGDIGTKTTAKPGFSIGMTADIESVSPYVNYQTGLYYSRSETEFTRSYTQTTGSSSYTYSGKTSWSLERLSIPLYAKIYPFAKSSKFYIKAGAMVNYQMRVNYETNSNQTTTDLLASQSNSSSYSNKGSAGHNDGLRTFVPDAVVGLGYTIGMNDSFALQTEIAHQRGMLGIGNETNDVLANTTYLTFGLLY